MKITNTVILDIKGLVMESYHSGKDSEALQGQIKPLVNTAAFGFATFCSKYFDTVLELAESPMNIIAVTDGGNQYRKSILPTYKENRKKVEKDPVEVQQIEEAIKLTLRFLRSLGIMVVYLNGQEADDVIAYLCENLPGYKTVYTVDRDLIALANDTTFVCRAGNNEKFMVDKGIKVPPDLITLYKSIVGDASDGYKGIAGVGPKGWESLIQSFGEDGMVELSDVVKAQDRVDLVALQGTNKILDKCLADLENWFIQYRVAELAPQICNRVSRDTILALKWAKSVPSIEKLERVMTVANAPDLFAKYEELCFLPTLVTQENLWEVREEINYLMEETPFVAWDYETTDKVRVPSFQEVTKGREYVDMLNSEITGCSFSFGNNAQYVYYFSVDHKDTDNVDKSVVLEIIKQCEAAGKTMCCHNSMFEATVTSVQLEHDLACYEDTRLYAHHIDENTENPLKQLSLKYLGYKQDSYKDTLEKVGAENMSQLTGQQTLSYGADDSLVTAHLYRLFLVLTELEGTTDFIQKYECPATAAFVAAHIGGVGVDKVELHKQSGEDDIVLEKTMAFIRQELLKHSSAPNLHSVQNLYKLEEGYVEAAEMNKASTAEMGLREQSEAIKERKANYLTTLKQNCYYQEYVQVVKVKPFLPTVAQFKPVTEHLGLPPIENVSMKGIGAYLSSVPKEDRNTEQAKFFSLLAPAERDFKKKDTEAYNRLKDYCASIIAGLTDPTWEGTELNMDSPKQNQYLIYLLLGLPVRLRTKSQPGSVRQLNNLEGSPATDTVSVQMAVALDCLRSEDQWKKPILDALVEYKQAATRKKLYWKVWPEWLREGNIMNPGFNSCGTVTRRPTGSSPNLMQVAKGEVRKVFKAMADHVIVSIDWSGQELRLNADACQDETFMSAYTGEVAKDLHALTGCRIAPKILKAKKIHWKGSHDAVDYDFFKTHQDDDTPLGKVLKDARSDGKTVNFAAQFGAQKATLSRSMMISEDAAEEYLTAYNDTFPTLQVWKDAVVAQAKQDGFVKTSYGSKRHVIPGIAAGKDAHRWQRQAINFIIQGTAADMMKVALTQMMQTKLFETTDSMLIATVYDEILVEVPKSNLKQFMHAACDIMTFVPPGGTISQIPDCSFGNNWCDQIEVGYKPTQETIDEALKIL